MKLHWTKYVALAVVVIVGFAIVAFVVDHFKQKQNAKPKGLVGFKQLPPEQIS
jgi:hypothetical protein